MAEEILQNGASRGEFLARGAGIAGLAVGAGVWAGGLAKASKAEAASDGRSYVSGHFALDLGGIRIGLLKSMDGGEITAAVIEEPDADQPNISKKHIANVKYEDFTVQLGISSGKALYDWINASWAGKGERRDGEITVGDFDFKAKRKVEFKEALISEVKIPACDGSAKDPAYMTLKFAPEFTRNSKASGKIDGSISKGQKTWLPANFKFTLGDLPCKKVSKIDSFTIKQAIVTEEIGGEKEPGKLEFPNLKVTFPETDLAEWDKWFTEMVINGNSSDDNEKTGKLEFLGPNLKTVLCTIDLFNVGIFKLSYNSAAADGNAIKRMIAELYVERMKIGIR